MITQHSKKCPSYPFPDDPQKNGQRPFGLTKILSWFGILVNVVQKQQRVTVQQRVIVHLLVSFGKQVREPTVAGFLQEST